MNRKHFCKRRLSKAKSAVSEVLGTIMILAITVVLFTTIFATVSTLEGPDRTAHLNMEAEIRDADDEYWLNINHRGGDPIETYDSNIYLIADDETPVRYDLRYDPVEEEALDENVDMGGLSDIRYWDLGETVSLNVTDFVQDDHDRLTIMINTGQRRVWEGDIVIRDQVTHRPSFRDAGVVYPYDWQNYVEAGGKISIYARVSFYEELPRNVIVDLREIDIDLDQEDSAWGSGFWNLTHDSGNRYVFPEEAEEKIQILSSQNPGAYWLPIYAHTGGVEETKNLTQGDFEEDLERRVYIAEDNIPLGVGRESVGLFQPDLVVGDIRFSPRSPTHGDRVTITADVYNQGNVNYTAEWTMTDKNPIGQTEGVSGSTTFTRGPSPTRISAEFRVYGHGPHKITVEVSDELYENPMMEGDPIDDVNPEDNIRSITIQVDPYIMVVRDTLGGEMREAILLENELRGLNLDYTQYDIHNEDDIPDEDDLKEASMLIWMTGQDGNSLEEQAAHTEVDSFIEDGGVFWLIGYDIPEINQIGDLGGKLGYNAHSPIDITEETVFRPYGEDGTGTYGRFNYTAAPGDYHTLTPKSGVSDEDRLMDDDDNIFGVGYEAVDRQRTAVNSFLFQDLSDPGQRGNMVGEVVRWLTNMTTRSGVDVAVTSQQIEPAAPMFMDTINITATLRNNGPEDLYVTVRCERNGGEELLTPNEGDLIPLEKDGGVATVTFSWTATELGVQEFIAIADYYHEIDEVTRRNNDITYKDLEFTDDRIKVNVHYSTLLVDADHSEYEDYTNVTRLIEDSFNRLGYEVGRNYDYVLVEQGHDGPDFDMLSEYNAVIWVTGQRSSNVLTYTDIENLKEYMDHELGANLMLVGEHIISHLEGFDEHGVDGDAFLRDHLGISPDSIEIIGSTPSVLQGQRDNPLSHGLEYEISGSSSLNRFELVENDDTEILFTDRNKNNLASIRDDGSSKVVYMGVNLDRFRGPVVSGRNYDEWPGEVTITSEAAVDEFIYTSLWQFGQRDERAELRMIDHDIEFSGKYLQTGRTYEVRAEVQNIGYRGATALIRIREGENYIGAETAFIEGSQQREGGSSNHFIVEPGTATIEITWRPSMAGDRNVRVSVDPLRRTREIAEDGESEEGKLMEFHNQAVVTEPVYYFYDDMEHGTAKWTHDSTLFNIDGMGPLSFMDEKDPDTHVEGDWDWSMSGSTSVDGSFSEDGVYLTDDPEIKHNTHSSSYSAPRAYWMPETQGDPALRDRAPLDLVILFDSGQTMAPYIDDVVEAAEAAIDMLQPGDRVALFRFGAGGSVHEHLLLTDDNSMIGEDDPEGDKDTIKGLIPDGTQAPQKSLLNGASRCIEELYFEGRDDAVKGIITLTDGLSTQDSTSQMFAPGADSGDEPHEIGAAQWFDGPDGQKGLLGSPYNIMSITISDLIEPRHHWVSATSTANVSYGILERDTGKLSQLYQMFVMDLMQSEQGDLHSAPGDVVKPLSNDINMDSSLGNLEVVEDVQFFVYSDAFTTGHFDDQIDYYDWDGGRRLPAYGEYDDFDFSVATSSGKIGVGTDRWVWLESSTQGHRISNTVHPRDTLDELQGSYVVKEAYANMFVDTSGSASLTLRINDGEFEHTGITGNGDYINIPLGVSDAESFTFELIHDGPNGQNIILDDLSFTYEIDYYPGVDDDYGPISSTVSYRHMTTPAVELGDMDDLKGATLEFQNRYKLTQGTNGGFIYMWGRQPGDDWNWEPENRLYVEPEESYTGNLHFTRIAEQEFDGGPVLNGQATGLIDAHGDLPYWGYNGKSADRTFDWTHERVNIGRHTDFLEQHEEIRFIFVLAQMGGVTREQGWRPEMGWYLDNVRFKVSSAWNSDGPGYWNLVSASQLEDEMGITPDDNYHDRTLGNEDGHYWMFTTEVNGEDRLPEGIDSSLYTSTIDLSNAVNPELTAYVRFNLEDGEQLPPDGFRVEISADDGRTWDSLTSGRRSGWGVSGEGGQHSGENEDGSGYGWVSLDSLSRVNTDLSAWRGERVILRFRVFTNLDDEYADASLPRAIFIDDVVVTERGATIPLTDGEAMTLAEAHGDPSPLTDVDRTLSLESSDEQSSQLDVENDMSVGEVYLNDDHPWTYYHERTGVTTAKSNYFEHVKEVF